MNNQIGERMKDAVRKRTFRRNRRDMEKDRSRKEARKKT